MHSRLQLLSTVSAVDDLPMRLGRLVEPLKTPTKNYVKRAPEPLTPGLSIKDGKMAYSPPIEQAPYPSSLTTETSAGQSALVASATPLVCTIARSDAAACTMFSGSSIGRAEGFGLGIYNPFITTLQGVDMNQKASVSSAHTTYLVDASAEQGHTVQFISDSSF